MLVRFADADLARLECDRAFTGGYGAPVIKGFRKAMQAIRAAVDERDLYQMKSLRFEKLKGNRAHQRSMRLNERWRLILQIVAGEPKNTVVVVSIEDYH